MDLVSTNNFPSSAEAEGSPEVKQAVGSDNHQGEEIKKDLHAIILPAVQKIDLHVTAVCESQVTLRNKIDEVTAELQRIAELQTVDVSLEPYLKKLLDSKKRIDGINSTLISVNDRLGRLQRNVIADTTRKSAAVKQQKSLLNALTAESNSQS